MNIDEGLHHGKPNAITTYSGKIVQPLDMSVEDVDIQDIGWALSRQCRYNGHTGGHLSVARHSIWVSGQLTGRYDAELEMWGLLHDAAEAYIGDLVKPLKVSEELSAFVDVEARLERVIAFHFGLTYPMPDAVHVADRITTVEDEMPGLRWTWDSRPNKDYADFMALYERLDTIRRYVR